MPKEEGEKVEEIFEKGTIARKGWDQLGSATKDKTAISQHIEEIKKYTNSQAISKRGPLVIIDCGNGTASNFAPKLFRELGCQNSHPKRTGGRLLPGRGSEPTEANLKDLIATVKSRRRTSESALTVMRTGSFSLTRTGVTFGATSPSHCVQRSPFERRKAPLSRPLPQATVPKKPWKKPGGKMEYVKVGVPYISGKMAEINAVSGGEEAGGSVWPEISWGKDGLMTAAKTVEENLRFRQKIIRAYQRAPHVFQLKGGSLKRAKRQNRNFSQK